MTAADLYECDPGFRGFLAVWVENRRCPLELVDYLLDRDMEGPAECARWCAAEPDRDIYDPPDAGRGGPCPLQNRPRDDWFFLVTNQLLWWSNSVPLRFVTESSQWFRTRNDKTPESAIVALMDAWVVPAVAGIDTGGILRG